MSFLKSNNMEWLSVKKELPPPWSCKVIICTQRGVVKEACWDKANGFVYDFYTRENSEWIRQEVSYWMPMPEPHVNCRWNYSNASDVDTYPNTHRIVKVIMNDGSEIIGYFNHYGKSINNWKNIEGDTLDDPWGWREITDEDENNEKTLDNPF